MNNKFTTRTENKTLGSVISDLNNPRTKINLNPEYQRNIVWSEEQQKLFIDSLNRGIVPQSIIMNVNTKTGERICIDGKQRLSTIKDFSNGKLYLETDDEILYYDKKPDIITNKKFTKTDTHFENLPLLFVYYYDLEYEDQLEIFNRIQNGKPAKEGELISSKIKDQKICDDFNKFCDQQKNLLINYAEIDRDKHKHIIMLILYMIYNEKLQICNDKNKLNKFIEEFTNKNNKNKFQKLLKELDETIKHTFTNDLLNNKIILKKKINNNLLLSIVYIIYCKYNNNWKNFDDKTIMHIRKVIQILNKNKTKYKGDSMKILDKIKKDYEKEMKKQKNIKSYNNDEKIVKNKYDTNSDNDSDNDSNNDSNNGSDSGGDNYESPNVESEDEKPKKKIIKKI